MCGFNPMAKNIISFSGSCFNKKSQFLLFLALSLVITASFLAVFLSSSVSFHGSKGSLALNRRTLVEIPSRNGAANNNVNLHQDVHQTSPTATTTTSTFAADATRNERQFQMAAHEVPSGPNPESN